VICGKTDPLSDGSRYYMIRYYDHGAQKEFLAKSNELQLKRKAAELLTGHCFKVTDSQKFGRVMTYIEQCLIRYGDELEIIKVAENNGWNEDFSSFAIGKEAIIESGVIPIYTTMENPLHVEVFKRKGTEEKWTESVKDLLEYDLVRFLFYDSMSACLLKLLFLEGHVFEHAGKTRSGKTTISKLIASAIGNPKDQLRNPGSSEKGIVAHVDKMCDLPTFVEEATTKRAREVVKAAIYDIANGMQKTRARIDGQMRDDIKTFKAVTHFTTEGSIRDELEHAGELYRVNTLEEMLPYIEDLRKIDKGIEENYGFFIIKFVQEIIKKKGDLERKYEEFYNLFSVDVKENKNLIESSKKTYAGIMVSGWLCERVFRKMGIKNKNYKDIVLDYFNKCVKKNFVELDHIRALRLVNEWVLRNEIAFLNEVDQTQDLKMKEPYGILTDEEIRIASIPFTKLMRDNGFVVSNILKCWEEEGITITMKSCKGRYKFRLGSGSTEGVLIKRVEMEKKLFNY
jgi:uncharacterized protein (DUF927 family)